MGFDTFEEIGNSRIYRCKTCGEEVPAGIINISSHWAECTGKEKMAFIRKVGDLPLTTEDKMDIIKNEFNINQ